MVGRASGRTALVHRFHQIPRSKQQASSSRLTSSIARLNPRGISKQTTEDRSTTWLVSAVPLTGARRSSTYTYTFSYLQLYNTTRPSALINIRASSFKYHQRTAPRNLAQTPTATCASYTPTTRVSVSRRPLPNLPRSPSPRQSIMPMRRSVRARRRDVNVPYRPSTGSALWLVAR